jgi:hypothetical protein
MPGCISKPIVTPAARACSASPVQYGMPRSDHCHSSASVKSGGHGQVTQFGRRASGWSPGQPLNATTVGTSNRCASSSVLRHVAWCVSPIAGSGCSGLPCCESAEISMSRAASAPRRRSSADASESISSGSACALPT